MIHNLRTTHARHISVDRAIVDLLELQELNLAPGILTTSGLRELWGCSQSQVSRRLSAVAAAGLADITPGWGAYQVHGVEAVA